MPNIAILQALARLIVAHRAYRDGEVKFAGEVLAGAWDHTNRADISEVYEILLAKPSIVAAVFGDITR